MFDVILVLILKHTFYLLGQYSLHLNSIPNQPKKENIIGVLQKTEAESSVQDENKSVLNTNQEISQQYEQEIAMYVTLMCCGVVVHIRFCFSLTYM